MHSFSHDEENCPVPTQSPPTSAAGVVGSETVFGKTTISRITSFALSSVDSNSANLNGPPPVRSSPPPPSSPPPAPPTFRQPLADDRPLYYHRQRSSTLSDNDDHDESDRRDDASSIASSTEDMTGHGSSSRGGGGRSSAGATSSQRTTAVLGEDLRLGSCADSSVYDKDDGRDDDTDRPISLTNSPSYPPPPQRASPPPPIKQPSPPAQPLNQPAAPSLPPPPPPKPEALSRKSKQLQNGGPISVPNPMVDRARASLPHFQSQPTISQMPLRQSVWTNENSTEESEQTDTSPDDTHPRHSVASTGASSIQPPIQVLNKDSDSTAPNGVPDIASSVGPVPPTIPISMTAPSLGTDSLPPGQLSSSSLNAQREQPGQPSVPPHRFSSPPAYNASATYSSAANTHISPSVGLKHRHTLEVPKLAAPRNSRDGIDSAGVFASGRFSPTAVGGVGSGSASGTGSIGGRRASLSLVRRNTRSLHSELPRDEVVPDEDALRWAEAYRQKRASKKRRMEQDDDQVLVGTKVDESHANWVAAYNMLTGIRVSVSRTNAKLDRPLTDEDFEAKQKSTFDITGNELVPSAKYDFKFKDYAPWVFRHLRALFHLDPADYLMSLAGKYILSELGSPGKSGSFFYFSRDYRYIIKTIHHSEHKFLRKILKDYYKHVTENPNTLLSQFFGLHRVKMPYGRKIHFVVMNNLFPPHRDIHQTFDLKGSTLGRDYPEEKLSQNPRATLKDLNWLRRHQHLELGMIKKRLFLEQLQRDVKLLQRLHIMDYSLLVGTHDLRRGNDENLRGKILQVFEPGGDNNNNNNNMEGPAGSVLMRTPSKLEHQRKTRELRQMLKSERPIPIGQSNNQMPDELGDNKQSIFYKDDGGLQATHQDNTPADEVYYLGVIDCLTHYGIVKKIEHFWKGLSNDRNQISAMPPQQYGERFLKFMSGITMSPEDAAREPHNRGEASVADAGPAAANADPYDNVVDGPDGGIIMASGRDKGKDPAQHVIGGWSSNLRHRSGNSVHSQRNGELWPGTDISEAAAHRIAEHEAEITSPVQDGEVTQIAVSLGSGMVLSGAVAGPTSSSPMGPSSSSPAIGVVGVHSDRRESMQQPALPIVEEAGEGSSTGSRSGSSRISVRTTESDGRPLTPAKDGEESAAGFANPVMGHHSHSSSSGEHSPPTTLHPGYLKPESADSGYGVSGTRSRSGTLGSGRKLKAQLSRESLNKELPPLPRLGEGAA